MVMQLRLPYVYAERLPSGRVRYRFERWGRKVTLKGDPGSPDFMEQYHALMDRRPARTDLAQERLVRGSVEWLVGLYLADLERQVAAGLKSPLTLKGHRHHLGRLVDAYGKKDARMPRGKALELLDKYHDTPGARHNLRKAMSALYRWAIERDHVSGPNPMADLPTTRPKSTGYHTSTLDEVRKYLAHHPPGTMARRAMLIVLCTAARREDLCKLGRQHEIQRDGKTWLRWQQCKAPHEVVEIPMLDMLRDEVAGHPNAVYLLTQHGRPFTTAGLGNRARRWFDEAGIPGSLHSVRKGLASILPELGASNYEIDVLLGHALGSKESQGYVRGAQRAQIAAGLSEKMERIKL